MTPIRRNFLALTGLQVANILLPLLTLPYLFRTLGPERFGAYSLCQAVLAQAVIITDYGFNLSATQQVARSRQSVAAVSEIFWSVEAAKALTGIISLCLILTAVAAVPQFKALPPLVLAGSPLVIAAIIFPQWLFQGLERMTVITSCSLGARFVTIPFIFLMVTSPDDVALAMLISACGPLMAGIGACVFIHRQGLVKWHKPQLKTIFGQITGGFHLFVSNAAISLYTTITPITLGLLAGTHAVGIFSAADRIRQALQSLLSPIGTVFFPKISALHIRDPQAARKLTHRLLVLQGTAASLAATFLIVFADPLLRLVVGQSYSASTVVLQILAPTLFLVALSNVFGIQTMLPLGMGSTFTKIVMLSGILNLTLIALLAPRIGAPGAAIGVLCTEATVTLVMAAALKARGINIFKN